jgi:hypothetical protein
MKPVAANDVGYAKFSCVHEQAVRHDVTVRRRCCDCFSKTANGGPGVVGYPM